MKKIISILLVAMLIIGMFPATALTAFAADTYELATSIAAGDTVVLVCSSKKMELSAISTTSTKYGLGVAYTSVPSGAMPLTVEEGSSSGTYSFKASAGYLYWSSGNSLQTNATKSVNSSWTVTFSGDNATIANAKDGSRKLQWNASSPRFACYTSSQTAIQLYKLSGGSTEPDVPACQHTNWELRDASEATCIDAGYTGDKYCLDCETVFEDGEPIPATGEHNYVDGTCSVCGAEEPEAPTGTTIVFEFGANGSATHKDGSTNKSTYTETNGSYTLNLTGGTNMYPSSYDAKGNSCIKLGTSSKTGGFSFTVPADVTSVVIAIGQYKANTTKITVNGTAYTLQNASNNGAYDAITVDTTSTKTVTLTTVSGGVRAMVNSITYVIAGSTDEPDCEHTNTTAIGEAKNATCTEDGITAGVKCADCGHEIEAQKTIEKLDHKNKVSNNDAIEADCETEGFTDSYYCPDCETTIPAVSTGFGNHNYADGFCTVCGEEQPDEVTLSLANGTNCTSYSKTQQVYAGNGITLTNDKAGSSNDVYDASSQDHARFYKGSTVTIACAGMTKIVLACDGTDYLFNLAASDDYTVTVDGLTVTVEFTAAVDTYTFTMSENQARVNSLTVTCADASEPECTHENKVSNEDAKAPTCVEPGQTNSYTCPDCGETIAAEPIPATGEHNYVDGFCSVCEAAEPQRYYIAATRGNGTAWYMTSDLGTASTKRYQAVAADILPSNIDPDEADSNYVFLLTDNGDGTYYLQAEGVEGDNYLYHSGTTNSGNYASQETALKLTMTVTEDGKYNFHYAGSDEERYLSLNNSTGSDYFAWYKNTQVYDLVLIPVEEAEDQTATLYGNVDGITVTGNLTLDLNGFAATNVTAEKIYACDSSATKTTEGTGSLTTTSEVVTDNTVNGKRYIALNDNGTYTFHVLDLKLSAVSLRASQAGIYYKAEMNCDKTLKDATEYHGMVVSVNDMPGADFGAISEEGDNNCWTMIQGAPAEGNMTSCAVFGIFKVGKLDNAARGEMKIYANAYLKLTTGEIIMADTTTGDKALNDDGTKNEDFDGIAWSLKDVIETLNTKFSTLEADDQTNLVKFYEKWASAMNVEGKEWAVDAIRAAATPAE